MFYVRMMGTKDDIVLLKKQLKELQIRLDALKDFTIDEFAKTRVGIRHQNEDTDKENKERGVVY